MEKKVIKGFLIAILLILCALPFAACEPPVQLTIINNTNTNIDVLVYFNTLTSVKYYVGELNPGKTTQYTFNNDAWPGLRIVHIFGLNETAGLVLYHEYTREEVQKLGEKVTIVDEDAWHEQPVWRDEWGKRPW